MDRVMSVGVLLTSNGKEIHSDMHFTLTDMATGAQLADKVVPADAIGVNEYIPIAQSRPRLPLGKKCRMIRRAVPKKMPSSGSFFLNCCAWLTRGYTDSLTRTS